MRWKRGSVIPMLLLRRSLLIIQLPLLILDAGFVSSSQDLAHCSEKENCRDLHCCRIFFLNLKFVEYLGQFFSGR